MQGGNCAGYWLSSPRYGDLMNFVYFNGKIGSNDGNVNTGIRPLICLKLGVKLQESKRNSTSTEIVYKIVK